MRHHCTLTTLSKTQPEKTQVLEGCRAARNSHTFSGRNAKQYSHFCKQFWQVLIKLESHNGIIRPIPTYIPKRNENMPTKDWQANVHNDLIYTPPPPLGKKMGKPPLFYLGEWISKSQYSHTVDYYSTLKRNKLLIDAMMQISLKSIMPSERSQTQIIY